MAQLGEEVCHRGFRILRLTALFDAKLSGGRVEATAAISLSHPGTGGRLKAVVRGPWRRTYRRPRRPISRVQT